MADLFLVRPLRSSFKRCGFVVFWPPPSNPTKTGPKWETLRMDYYASRGGLRINRKEKLNKIVRIVDLNQFFLFSFYLFKKYFLTFYLFTFRENGREGEREGEKHQTCKRYTDHRPIGDLAHNPSMFLDWELNWGFFGLQASPQSIEPHKPGLILFILINTYLEAIIYWALFIKAQNPSGSWLGKSLNNLPQVTKSVNRRARNGSHQTIPSVWALTTLQRPLLN